MNGGVGFGDECEAVGECAVVEFHCVADCE
ncbi:MAG: hypothetical protein RL215_3437 [Planctomycetota bacterium]